MPRADQIRLAASSASSSASSAPEVVRAAPRGSPTPSSALAPRRAAQRPTSRPPTPSSGMRTRRLAPVPKVNRVEMALLRGIDRVRDTLAENTERFARGLPANNALLWGARGMGKSSLVKAVHAEINRALAGRRRRPAEADRDPSRGHRDAARADGAAARRPRTASSSSATTSPSTRDDTSYKSLKAVLEGGIEGRPENVIFYATSNRRHLLPRDMMENERSTAINPGEAVEEKVSLSDRFGLWLGFHHCSQDEYLEMVVRLCRPFRPRRSRPRRCARRGARMGDDARLALGPHRLAVHPGSGRAAGQAAGRRVILGPRESAQSRDP